MIGFLGFDYNELKQLYELRVLRGDIGVLQNRSEQYKLKGIIK